MKREVRMMNTARADLIDKMALIDALDSIDLDGIDLDVYEYEQKYFVNDFSLSIVDDDHTRSIDLLSQCTSYGSLRFSNTRSSVFDSNDNI
jgi:lactate dehydrogenase-like 2-hydroxyacid dehydrogenase